MFKAFFGRTINRDEKRTELFNCREMVVVVPLVTMLFESSCFLFLR